MNALKYVPGDATAPQGSGPRLIAHVCNDIGAWGAGFVLALSKRWTAPEAQYRQWASEESFGLSQIQVVDVADSLAVVNMVAQRGLRDQQPNAVPLDYAALRICLSQLADVATNRQASVHMPRIGAGLGGGDWATISEIISNELVQRDVATFVYLIDAVPPAWGPRPKRHR